MVFRLQLEDVTNDAIYIEFDCTLQQEQLVAWLGNLCLWHILMHALMQQGLLLLERACREQALLPT